MGQTQADYMRRKAVQLRRLATECATGGSAKLLAIALEMEVKAIAMEIDARPGGPDRAAQAKTQPRPPASPMPGSYSTGRDQP